MSLVLCPECGAKISNKAVSCPHCGFVSGDLNRPISEQETYAALPVFHCDVEEWKPGEGQLSVIGIEDNRTLVRHFGNWKTIEREMPAIAQVIRSMADKEQVMVAKMDDYIKDLIEQGVYRFSIDKQGEILPTIRDSGGIVKQVRLEKKSFSPELNNSLNNLATQAAMTQILNEIEYVGDSIRGIHIELQNDRIALAESAMDKLKLASKMQDAKLREAAILSAVSSATDAKRVLMRNFSENLHFIAENSNKSDIKLFLEVGKGRDIPQKVEDAFQALIAITNCVQAECEGYAILGEYQSSKESLLQFRSFIKENGLDNRDTLLLLNENTPHKKMPVVDEFTQIAQRITDFDVHSQITGPNILMMSEENKDGTEAIENH
jgi:hypothetical protein